MRLVRIPCSRIMADSNNPRTPHRVKSSPSNSTFWSHEGGTGRKNLFPPGFFCFHCFNDSPFIRTNSLPEPLFHGYTLKKPTVSECSFQIPLLRRLNALKTLHKQRHLVQRCNAGQRCGLQESGRPSDSMRQSRNSFQMLKFSCDLFVTVNLR